MGKMKKFRNNLIMCLTLVFALVLNIMPVSALSGINTQSVKQTQEITESDVNANKYETYYYSDGIEYTYKGNVVEFISNDKIKAGSENIALKNKKTNINKTVDGNTVTINFSDLNVPIGLVSGKWNSTYNGDHKIVYKSDIPGKEEIKSDSENIKTLVINDLSPGEYHLTNGTIYEKANEWSPGIDGIGTEGNFGTLPNITIKISEDTNTDKDINYVPNDFANDLWLQYDFKEMKVGDKSNIYPRRIPQIISSSIANDVHRPNFNFEIIKGDSISLSTNKGNDKSIVTAEKEGSSIVKVTYDKTSYKGREYAASSPINTAYVVFDVKNNDSSIKISTDIKQTSYDTIYFKDGNSVDFDFTVDTTNADTVNVTCNGEKLTNNGKSYTAKLKNRSNIIGIEATNNKGETKSYYKVLDARKIEIDIKNKTNPGKKIGEGDTAQISFKGISNPVAKLATIYNPTWHSDDDSWGEPTKGTFVEYKNDLVGIVKGYCSQWDLDTNNTIEVKFDKKGTYDFSNGRIFSQWWGSPLGSDKGIEGSGDPNLGAPTLEKYFSQMPNFSVEVGNKNDDILVTGISLDSNSLEINEGNSKNINATVTPGNATNKSVKWTSSDENIASVENGKVTAKKPGNITITATTVDGNFKATCNVKVVAKEFVELQNLISEIEKLKENEYEPKEWKLLMEQLDKAKAVLNDENTSLEELKQAKESLQSSKDNLVSIPWKYEIKPNEIYPGSEVTVNFPNMPIPSSSVPGPTISLLTKYDIDIPGINGTIESENGKYDGELIKTIKFTVPKDVKPGKYKMTNGHVFAQKAQFGSFTFYKGEMPDIDIVVKEKVEIPNNQAPVINAKDVDLFVGDKFNPMDYVTATDKEDGDITNRVNIITNNVDTSKDGVYKVVYEVTDSNGNKASKTIKVSVKNKNILNDINGHWAQDQIQDFIDKNHIVGYPDNTFKPDNSITRAEFVRVVNKVYGFKDKGVESFNDVNESDWFYNDVCTAVKAGYIKGKAEDTFAPNDEITREEVAMILTTLNDNKDSNLDKSGKFIDGSDVSDWAKTSVEGAIEAGYIQGYGDGTIRAKSKITRAESVSMLNRITK